MVGRGSQKDGRVEDAGEMKMDPQRESNTEAGNINAAQLVDFACKRASDG